MRSLESMAASELWTSKSVTADVRIAAGILADFPTVTKVWFFGSAANRRALDFASDLDFAVEGLPATQFIPVLGRLLNQLVRPVDLIRWETANDAMRAQIASTGTLIHGA